MPKGIRGHNPRQFASVNPSKCTGCGICEYVCALEKEGFLRNPLRSRIRVIPLNSFFNTTMTCRFCEDAPCANACPRRALKQSERGGVLIIDEDRCNACGGWCVQACPSIDRIIITPFLAITLGVYVLKFKTSEPKRWSSQKQKWLNPAAGLLMIFLSLHLLSTIIT